MPSELSIKTFKKKFLQTLGEVDQHNFEENVVNSKFNNFTYFFPDSTFSSQFCHNGTDLGQLY